ncbi:MAG TPA: Hsp20 family protein [Rhizomicrobium sp.]|jgi:HSP20 family molecular chaperone IbpA|nr:Hsp20 family protein [Rhizomicrobium sp.]
MTTNRFFNNPFFLGFEPLERLLERAAKGAGDGYPPYNIEETSDGGIAITLAVAGFTKDDIAVTVEDRELVVKGRQNEADAKTFLHRGIAARQFLRSFVLAEGIEVKSAALENGLLRILLVRPDSKPQVRVIEIKSGGQYE